MAEKKSLKCLKFFSFCSFFPFFAFFLFSPQHFVCFLRNTYGFDIYMTVGFLYKTQYAARHTHTHTHSEGCACGVYHFFAISTGKKRAGFRKAEETEIVFSSALFISPHTHTAYKQLCVCVCVCWFLRHLAQFFVVLIAFQSRNGFLLVFVVVFCGATREFMHLISTNFQRHKYN